MEVLSLNYSDLRVVDKSDLASAPRQTQYLHLP